MSATGFLARADLMAEMLSDVSALKDIPVVVDRQSDLKSLLKKNLAEGKGSVIVIGFAGGTNIDTDKSGPMIAARYNVVLFAKSVLRRGQTEADLALEALLRAVHHWQHNPDSPNACKLRFEVLSVDFQPRPNWFAYNVLLQTPVQL